MLLAGERLVVDIEEWINKTSGRGSLILGVDKEDGEPPSQLAAWGVYLGLRSYEEVVPTLFAWADVHLHRETYEQADADDYHAKCVVYDNEGDLLITVDYDEWVEARQLPTLRPYANSAGEIDYWRLELTLNDIGRAFLVVDDFAPRGRLLAPKKG